MLMGRRCMLMGTTAYPAFLCFSSPACPFVHHIRAGVLKFDE